MDFNTWRQKQQVIIIDGSMSAGLEAQGLDLNDPLWTAKALKEAPEKIRQVHEDYYNAGANIAITASYQATMAGLEKAGLTADKSSQLIRKTVTLAKNARSNSHGRKKKWVAASVGPYGAYLADGSEYSGNYGLTKEQLKSFHRQRLELLLAEKPDLVAIETIPDRTEVQVLTELLAEYPSALAWLTVTLSDEGHLADGTALPDFQTLVESCEQVFAYGVNCVKPDLVLPALSCLVEKRTKPLVAYPNSGARYDADTKQWQQDESLESYFSQTSQAWNQLGCQLIGGCCRTTTTETRQLVASFRQKLSSPA